MTAWADPTFARRHWSDAPSDDTRLGELLDAATVQCQAYAPVLADPAAPPVNYQLATVYAARELYAASQRGEADVIGVGDYAIRARPLTASVKALLRPPGARFQVG